MGRIPKQLQLIAEQGMFSGTGFLVNIALVKLLSLEQYGRFASLIIVVYLLLAVVQSLVVQPLQVHVATERRDADYRSVLLVVLLPLVGLFSVAPLLLYVAGPGWMAEYRPLLPASAGYVAAFLLSDFLRKYFLARGRTEVVVGMTGTYLLGVAAGLAYGAYAGVDDLVPYLLLLGAAFVPGLLLGGIVYLRGCRLPELAFLRRYLRIHLLEGQWLLYAAVVQWLSSNLYVMTSGLLIGVEALGVLRFVQTLLGVINIVLQTLENYVLPRLSEAYRVSVEQYYRSAQRQLGWYQLATLAGLGVLFVFAREVIVLVGDTAFAPYAFVLRGMVLLYGVIVIAYPVRLLIRVTELNRSYFTAYLASFLFSLVSYRYLLGTFGVTGAVAGLIVNQLILQATWLVVLHKKQFKLWKLYTW
ncbi:O-antigen/teichoic acid export membrane protein [Neolewinella xylanilytica]|uniref:O-antigen/teichoic acid export membrane protein n=1 Tax=Neolewinella xylanilytica TaxID=1514080 RepID=A0A2S6I8N5_9BACT|nr:hypothetical protein [Neolewinella xylanilytica]PPK87838.1 O-antigen/teichoic acid export membrane protein [Neolewinella xylanilytica]